MVLLKEFKSKTRHYFLNYPHCNPQGVDIISIFSNQKVSMGGGGGVNRTLH